MWWSRDTGSLAERIRKRGLERIADRIKASAKDCIRFESQECRDEDGIALGASKLGGKADLPESTPWPGGDNTPFSFLAQINTRDLPDFDGRSDLPADTLLSFFYDLGTSPRGYNPKDREGWKVLATPLSATLTRRGTGIAAPYSPCRFIAWKDLSLPDPASDEIETWGMNPREDKGYTALYESLMPPHGGNGLNHQLLGYASTIQGDMRVFCELASQGLYWRTAAEKFAEADWEPFRRAGANWRLLFQLDTDSQAEFAIPKAGRLYFNIRESALKAANFDEVWAVTQIRGGSAPP